MISFYSKFKKEVKEYIPNWAKKDPVRILYNRYKFEGNLQKDNNLPSGRILYESIQSVNAKNAMTEINNALELNKEYPFIWSCSLDNGKIKWELRLHLYDYLNNEYRNVDKLLPVDYTVPHKNVVAISYDIYNRSYPLGDKFHLFQAGYGQTITLPFSGYGTYVKYEDSDVLYNESKFIYDNKSDFIKNREKYLKDIGCKDINLERLINFYPDCKELCVSIKYKNFISIIYIGVSIYDFINFLKKFEYPINLINHISNNKDKYKNLNHEISITYDIKNLEPISSSFYGII